MLIIDCGYWLCFVLGIGVLVERESFGVGISLSQDCRCVQFQSCCFIA